MLLTEAEFSKYLDREVWRKPYRGLQSKLMYCGPRWARSLFSLPSARKRVGLRARAYRLGKKRPWWSGGGYGQATTDLAMSRVPRANPVGM